MNKAEKHKWFTEGYDDHEGNGVNFYCPVCHSEKTHVKDVQHLALPYDRYIKEMAMELYCENCDDEFFVVFHKKNINEKTFIYYATPEYINSKIEAAKQDIDLVIQWSNKRDERH